MDAGLLTLVALCAVGIAVLAALSVAFSLRAAKAADAQGERAERAAEALDRANAAIASLNDALEQARSEVAALAQRQMAEAAVGQQRFDTTTRQLVQAGERVDALRQETTASLDKSRETVDAKLGEVRAVVDEKLSDTLTRQSGELRDQLGKFDARFSGFQTQIKGFQDQMNQGLRVSAESASKGLGEVRQTVERQLESIRTDNSQQLERMRATVDEKLSRTLNDRLSSSFKQVSEQLDTVSKGLGEMRSVASGVGDLKRVLSNVKARGILGEVQLGAILREILTSDQYETDVATVPDSRERVEYAVRIPVEGGEPVLLPIDSKFPGDSYEHLREALEDGGAEEVAAARRILEKQIKSEAKDISEKYLCVPATTNFGIMFLPFEGLYAEVVNMPGLVESLQRDYRVNVAGPSTMAAILNSLQMSYQTFAFQKRADEIQQVLSAVKAEFPNYQRELRKALKQIKTAEKTVDGIISTRTNVMERKLKTVTALDDPVEVARLLGTGDDAEVMEPDDADGADAEADGEGDAAEE